MAAGDLTTLAQVKRDLGITGAADDLLLSEWITGVSSWVVQYLSQPVISTTQNDVRDGRGGTTMVLRFSPVQSVTSLKIDGSPVVAATPGSNDTGYFLDSRGILRLRNAVFSRGVGNVEVVYVSGYATVPAALERAAARMVGWRYRERERIGQQSKSAGQENISYQTAAASEDVLKIIDQYRRVVP